MKVSATPTGRPGAEVAAKPNQVQRGPIEHSAEPHATGGDPSLQPDQAQQDQDKRHGAGSSSMGADPVQQDRIGAKPSRVLAQELIRPPARTTTSTPPAREAHDACHACHGGWTLRSREPPV